MELTPIIKVTKNCNLACKYCDYVLNNSATGNLDIKILTKFIKEYLYLKCGSGKKVFIWHGGEPLLMGLDYFKKIIELQNLYNYHRYEIKNRLQTNGTLLDNNFIQFFKKNNFSLGISFDGLPNLQKELRCFKNGNDSYTSVSNAISLCISNNVFFGVLIVVSNRSIGLAKDIYKHIRLLGIENFDFLPSIDDTLVGLNKTIISAKDFGRFMIEIFFEWIKEDNPNVHIRFFDNIIQAFLGRTPNLCKFKGNCSSYITLDNNGDIFPCDKYQILDNFKFGNIMESSLTDIISNANYIAFKKNTQKKSKQCMSCEFIKVCNGGCTFNKDLLNINKQTDLYCDGLKMVYSTIKEFVNIHSYENQNSSIKIN